MKLKRFTAILAACILLVCAATGCSSAMKSEQSMDSNAVADMNSKNEFGFSSEAMPEEGAAAGVVTDESGASTVEVTDTRKLIKTVSLNVQTKEYDAYIAALRTAVEAAGGYIEQSSANENGYYGSGNRYANITARVPADKLDAFIVSAGNKGKIVNQEEQVSDVTLDYVDMESRIGALKTERESLTKLLSQADSLENIIALQTRLSEVNYQIESYESQMRALENQISYSTVSISVDEVERVSAEDESTLKQIKTRLLNNLSSIKEDGKDFVVTVIGGLPYILIWGAVIFVGAMIAKAVIKKRRKKKAKKTSAPGTPQA